MWASKENNAQKNRKRIRRLLPVWSQDISIIFVPHPKVFFLSYLELAFEDKRILAFCPLQAFTNFYLLTFLSDTAGIPTRVLNHLLPVLAVSLSFRSGPSHPQCVSCQQLQHFREPARKARSQVSPHVPHQNLH